MSKATVYINDVRLPFRTRCPFCNKVTVVRRNHTFPECNHWYDIAMFRKCPDFYDEMERNARKVDLCVIEYRDPNTWTTGKVEVTDHV